jgi:hypothetical protein
MSFGRRYDPEQHRAEREAERQANAAALVASARDVQWGRQDGGTVLPRTPGAGKPQGKVSQAIRDSARGEECLMALPGVCLNNSEATIWSHARWPEAGKGGATKALDLAGCYACTACDAVYDGNKKRPAHLTQAQVDLAWFFAHLKSLVRLAEKGLLK